MLALVMAAALVQPGAAQNPPAQPADRLAFTAAMAIRNPDQKLAALEKVRKDFPDSTLLGTIDTAIFSTLVGSFPDRTDAIDQALDRIIARIAPTASPEARLSAIVRPVTDLITKKIMLDRASALLDDAAKGLDFERYFEAQVAAAGRANLDLPTREEAEERFNVNYTSRVSYERARIDLARGDAARAETGLLEALKLYESNAAILKALVDLYVEQDRRDDAETLLTRAADRSPASISVLRALNGFHEQTRRDPKAGEAALARVAANHPDSVPVRSELAAIYERHGNDERAVVMHREAVALDPLLWNSLAALARDAERAKRDSEALDFYLRAAATTGRMAPADNTAMRDLYRKIHGSDKGLEAEIDARYDALPKAVTPEPYVPSPNRSDRVVLLEMFTGSGCGPCVSADLALDAVMERYPAGDIAVLAFHEHIPAPDPMVVEAGLTRRGYYAIRGVPTFNIDGGLGRLGGGGRSNTVPTYKDYIEKIDRALETPSEAGVRVEASVAGDTVRATATVTGLPAGSRDLRLHIVLAERELAFGGENGIRRHPMVVRAAAGDRGEGLALVADGTQAVSFSLTSISQDVAGTLAGELEKPTRARGTYSATDHAMTTIDPARLVVVAFVQDANHRVLQAAHTGVAVGGAAGSGRSGGR